MSSAPGYVIKCLGCKVNRCEADSLERILRQGGLIPSEENPAIALVHSCAVTEEALRKTRQAVRGLRQRYPESFVLLTGCGAAPDLRTGFDQVDAFVPAGPELELRAIEALDACPAWAPSPKLESIEYGPSRTRGFLKIQDGCDQHCAYCIVPLLRGPSHDVPMEEALNTAHRLVAQGCRELVVCGVSVGLYGRHRKSSLAAFLTSLHSLKGIERIRLSSLHPRELTPELLDVWAGSPLMAPHVHLPLQSGSARILKAMNRGYTPEEFFTAVQRLRDHFDQPAFNTDVLVGYPGETDRDFEDTARLCAACGFSRMHVFPYSIRPGTEAPGQAQAVPGNIARTRARHLREQARHQAVDFSTSRLNQPAQVLVESHDKETDLCYGYTARYIRVCFEAGKETVGRLIDITLTSVEEDGSMRAKLLP